jgi:heterodisulfide reductase subunit D
MFDLDQEKNRFGEQCTACGLCVTACPIVPLTDIKDNDPAEVMASVMNLYRGGRANTVATTRIYSCMGCLSCKKYCPEDLNPALGLALAASILVERGEAVPRALSFLLPETKFNLMKAVEAFQVRPDQRPWVTSVARQNPSACRTVLFTGCTGIMQPDVVLTALDIIRRIDPTVTALGGVDYCCGDTALRAGRPRAARDLFLGLVEALNGFSPEDVVFLCPTCKGYFDRYQPRTSWIPHFITRFLADHITELGPFEKMDEIVTIHDACHLIRSENPDLESPRDILKAITGIKIVEMADSRENGLCCGATAMAAIGTPGVRFRARRLKQAEESGADIMALYCPACLSIFATERVKLPFRIESVITLLGKSMGIVHEDRLYHYMALGDPESVLTEARDCLQASDLPQEKLVDFCRKYFKRG